ncbi:TraB/GumN family protein [Brevundimonas sp. NPDC090276]|uniref:TraB/GumN family protein n=1 Tax=Brevundimonas sp. NPDC090276 TaxID=3363956 RepID=UPI00383A2871
MPIARLSDCLRSALTVGAALSALLLAPSALAQAPSAVSAGVVAAPAGSGPGLWVVKDEDSTLYLFGTIHALKPETPWGTGRADKAFASADEYWFEVADLNDQAGVVPLIQAKGVSPDRPLSSLLTAEEFADLDAVARTVGATALQLDQLRPWLASLQLALASIQKAGYVASNGGDQVLHARAAATGKPIKGFETMPQQIGFIADLSEEAQLAMLRSSLKEFDQADAFLGRMVTAWSTGDVDGLDALIGLEAKAESPELYAAIFARRNEAWAEQIQTLLAGSGTAFISVGAGHLAGADSLQTKLAQRGITATRIRD